MVQGVVLTNTYLAQFKRGWRYTFIYELRDNEGGAGHQGLYHEDATPKPSATYIHNLTSILADKAPIASPGQLNYIIPNEPGNVHDLLLEKSDGVFELVVWGERVCRIEQRDGEVRQEISINTDIRYHHWNHTRPNLENASTVPLAVSDHAMIIELE